MFNYTTKERLMHAVNLSYALEAKMEMDVTKYDSELLNDVLFCPMNKQLTLISNYTIYLWLL